MRIYLYPGLGLRIRYPYDPRILPPEGASVAQTRYWLRRLQCGDAVSADPRPKTKTKTKPKASKAAKTKD